MSKLNCRKLKRQRFERALVVAFCLYFAISCHAETNKEKSNAELDNSIKEIEQVSLPNASNPRKLLQNNKQAKCKANHNEFWPNDKSNGGLNKMLANLIGDFIVDKKQKSFFEADFNGDGCQDIALIVSATNAFHQIKNINDAARNTNIVVIKLNLRTGAELLPQGRKQKENVFPKTLQARSDRALVVIHGGQYGWNWKHANRGKIFLLLDAVFTKQDCQDCYIELVLKKPQTKGWDCFPKNAKGAGLFTGGEDAGKLIFFNGKKYRWTQCGD